MSGDDRKRNDGKTVIGSGIGTPHPAPLPGGGQGGRGPSGGASQKTVIGGLPPASAQRPAPGGGTWGEVDAGSANAWMGAEAPKQSFFPEHRTQAPARPPAPARKISLETALAARTAGHSAEVNPLTASAATLLILFGRLRSQVVEMQAIPLMEHVTREIDAFEARALEAGVDPHDAQVAKYVLCGTADDIVQNLPGTDHHVWVQYSMVARFFGRRTSGVGVFQEVDKALANPTVKYDLLELMLTCLQLGFEGQYRTMPNGEVELQRVRRTIYETLRRVKPRGDDDISPRWKGVEIAARRNLARTPAWVVASIAAALLLGAYLLMRGLLAEEGNTLAGHMLGLHPSDPIRISRVTVTAAPEFVAYEPPAFDDTQLDRIREDLSAEVEAGQVEVDTRGDFIFVRVNNLVLFASGRAEVKPEFAEMGARIAAALDDEPGPIRVEGHTDNVPLSGRGRFKDNFELSVARATSVKTVLAEGLSDPDRIEVVGKGEDDPIADNATPEGRAQNRRVEIMIQREETL